MKKKQSKKNLHAALRRNWHKDGTYESLLESRPWGWRCWICGKDELKRKLDIDHDHATMKPRGLLCRGCNMRLRKDHKPDWLRRAADYLEKTT